MISCRNYLFDGRYLMAFAGSIALALLLIGCLNARGTSKEMKYLHQIARPTFLNHSTKTYSSQNSPHRYSPHCPSSFFPSSLNQRKPLSSHLKVVVSLVKLHALS